MATTRGGRSSFHRNNVVWPLVITRSDEARPVTVGIVRFLCPETGIDLTSLTAGTVVVVAPLPAVCIIAQRRFVHSFMRSGFRQGARHPGLYRVFAGHGDDQLFGRAMIRT